MKFNDILNHLYSSQWLERVLKTKEYKDYSYLRYTNYNTHAELYKLTLLMNYIEKYICHNRKDHPRILEIGCSLGNITLPLLTLSPQLTVVELSHEYIEYTKARIKKFFPQTIVRSIEWVNIEISKYEPKDVFDVIVACDVLEHLATKELETTLTLLSKCIAPDGLILCSLPNGFGLLQLTINGPARMLRNLTGRTAPPGYDHLQTLSLSEWTELLASHVDIIAVISIDCLTCIPFVNRSRICISEFHIFRRLCKVFPRLRSVANRWLFVLKPKCTTSRKQL